MKIVFCNIAYLKFYDGRVAGELVPSSGGRWVQQNEDAHEKWNFLNFDGFCYGYVQTGHEQLHLERMEKVLSNSEVEEDVTVIWCANHPQRGTVICGVYEKAQAYRFVTPIRKTVITGLDRWCYFKTAAENAYLFPEEKRTFTIGRASVDGKGKGFGQANVWWADSDYAKKNIIPQALKFIEENKKYRINTLPEAYEMPKNAEPLTEKEFEEYIGYSKEYDLHILNYAWRDYSMHRDDVNRVYNVGNTLGALYQYSKAIPWFEKTIELDPKDWETKGQLMYYYQQCEMFDESISLAKSMLTDENAKEEAVRSELYSAIADDYLWKGDIKEAIAWLDKILEESTSQELIKFTKENKKEWSKLL